MWCGNVIKLSVVFINTRLILIHQPLKRASLEAIEQAPGSGEPLREEVILCLRFGLSALSAVFSFVMPLTITSPVHDAPAPIVPFSTSKPLDAETKK